MCVSLPITFDLLIQDLVADSIELKMAVGKLTAEIVEVAQASDAVMKACKICALSEGMSSQAAFARQLRRKFV
jgi:sulfur relay (sulfurtransferase) complex TusBCD TusD component (DsrE family)